MGGRYIHSGSHRSKVEYVHRNPVQAAGESVRNYILFLALALHTGMGILKSTLITIGIRNRFLTITMLLIVLNSEAQYLEFPVLSSDHIDSVVYEKFISADYVIFMKRQLAQKEKLYFLALNADTLFLAEQGLSFGRKGFFEYNNCQFVSNAVSELPEVIEELLEKCKEHKSRFPNSILGYPSNNYVFLSDSEPCYLDPILNQPLFGGFFLSSLISCMSDSASLYIDNNLGHN